MVSYFLNALLWLLSVLLFLSLLSVYSPTDDTDFGAWRRSGLQLFTDARTGCQYVARDGALTPRMGADGKQVCNAKGGE